MPETRFPLSRREFGLSLAGSAIASRMFAAGSSLPWMTPANVRTVFLAVPTPTWPRPDLDVIAEKTAMERILAGLERRHATGVKFTGGTLVRTVEDAQALVKSIKDEDALLVVDLTSGTSGMLRPIHDIEIPILLYARPYSGWSYADVVQWAQAGRKVDLVSTSEPGELDLYMKLFQTLHQLKHSKVIVVTQAKGSKLAEGFTTQFGTEFAFPGYGPLKDAYDSIDAKKAQKDAEVFARGALRVVEPKPQEITDSMRFYHAVMKVLEQEKANAMTIDCLGGFKRGDLPAYPCLAWSKLNDAGLYGVCEGDVLATMTQMLLTSFSGKPCFVSDPIFDTSRNEMIHAHCVSATNLMGIGGPASPYAIRSHMEDNKGVSIQVIVPEQETVTVGKFLNPASFAVSTGEILGNVDDPRGCRTKFRTRVADVRKFLDGFSGGLHRVVVYGDYLRTVERMGRLMGFKVIREC